MKIDAPGLVAAAQRLISAVEDLGASGGVPHSPLAADPASVGAAGRLTTAGAELTAALSAHVTALVVSLEHLTGAAMTFVETDERNAAAIATLNGSATGPAMVAGSAPPPPPVPPDVRAPMPPPAGMMPEAISAATHSGTPGAGEPFMTAWSHAAGAARDASANIRSAVSQLPETLDGPASTPAVSRHLLSFADGLDDYADRAHTLVSQSSAYARNLDQAREDIPTPQQLTAAQNRVVTLVNANAASGGRYAVPLANAIGEKNQLGARAVTGYAGYHETTDAATAGQDPGTAGVGLPGKPNTGNPDAGEASGEPDPIGDLLSPEKAGDLTSMLPQMLPAVLGAAGGLMGAVTKLPQSLMQAGTQAVSAATQSLSGLGKSNMNPLNPGGGGPGLNPADAGLGDLGGAGGAGGGAPTTPAGGAGPPELGVAPSTGAPPTPVVAPVGATAEPGPATAGRGGMGMGMPMGGMGGLGGAPGGGGGKEVNGRPRKVVSRDIPHTEDVTGRVDTDRLSAAAAGHRERNPKPPNDDSPPDSAGPVIRRLVTRPPKEQS